jgi:DNA-3-methyladenine glycosylase I
MSGYCDIAPGHEFHGPYHDREYGFPTDDEIVLFERLSLEIFQAGLSWLVVLRKRDAFKKAFAGWNPKKVAKFGEKDIERLLGDAAIIRSRAKIEAVIENARRMPELVAPNGSFAGWIAAHHPLTKDEWVKLFRKSFKFMGPEIVGEFLMSIGYLPGAHRADCPAQKRINKLHPPCAE